MKNIKLKVAFSLSEIVITSLIIFSLILIAFYYYYVNIEYANIAVFIQNYRFIKIASQKYYIDKGRYPQSFYDLFSDPYREYLPTSLASNFLYSPWGSEVYLKSCVKISNFVEKNILFLYLEYQKNGKKYITSFGISKILKELYFYNYYTKGEKHYLVFVISTVNR